MIPWNYSIYGINSTDYTAGRSPVDSQPTGTLLNDHYTLDVFYGNTDPLYSADRSKQFDESLYLWHIGPESAAGTNAAYCIESSSTLNFQVKMNKANNVPLACQLTNATQNRFQRFASGRMCYDYFDVSWTDYLYSRLFVDINRLTFCARPVCQVYDKSTNQASTQSIQNVAAYINQNPTDRYVYGISFEMYNSYDMPRTRQAAYIPGRYANESGYLTFDILTERPIPENASAIKTDMLYERGGSTPHNDWITDKCYSPFTQVSSGLWYSGTTQTFNPYYIGFRTARTVTELINGFANSAHGGKVTGAFVRYSDKIQDFDDVNYKWRTNVYYNAGAVFLDNGFPLSSLTGTDTVNVFSSIEILDKKGLSDGAAIQAAVKHECAFYGFYFADTLDDAQNAVLGTASTHIYLPEFVGGITTGNYFTGDDIPNVPYANSTSVGDGSFEYEPPEGVDGDEGDFSTQLQSGALSAGTVYYALSDTELKDLLRYLNTTYTPDETTLAEDFKGANPFEYITSVKYYPFCLPYSVAQSINVGPIGTGVTGYIMPYTYGNSSYSFFDMGSFTFTPRYNNFLDYSGTQINLYLPWCGTQQLDPAMWIASPGQQPITLNIKYSFDYVTGAVTAFLFRDSMLIDTADGQVGIDIPMSALATGSYQQQIAQAQIAYKQAATSTTVAWLGLVGSMIGTAVAAASGVGAPAAVAGVVGIASSAGQLIKNTYQEESVTYTLDHTSPNVGSVSAASPFNAAIFDQRPRILISRPQLQQLPTKWAESYGKSIGYACSIPTKLNNAAIKGLTVVQAPRLEGIKKVIGSQTFTPTREELDLIRHAMAEGIIL